MKALDWHRFFQAQREHYGKRVFTLAELANAAGTPVRGINTEVSRLVKRGWLVRYAQGRYGPEGAGVEDTVAMIDGSAYVTGFFALHRHGLVTQVPTEVTCITNRRYNRSRERLTPLGKLIFVCVRPRIYHRPEGGLIAPPEQALCDFVYLLRRESLAPESLVTFHNLDTLKRGTLKGVLPRYPRTVTTDVERLVGRRL
jgi:hypothetical protein